MNRIIIAIIALHFLNCDTYSYVTLLDSGTTRNMDTNVCHQPNSPGSMGSPNETVAKQDIKLANQAEAQEVSLCPHIEASYSPFSLEFFALPHIVVGNDFYTNCSATYYISFANYKDLDFSKLKSLKIDFSYILKLYANFEFNPDKIGVYADYLEFGTVANKIETSLGHIGGYDISSKRNGNAPSEKRFIGIFDIQNNNMPEKLFVRIKSYYRNKNIPINQTNHTNDFEYFAIDNSKIKINSIQLVN